MNKKIKVVILITLFTAKLIANETYYMLTDFSSIPEVFSSENKGVLKDETSNGEDILKDCNSINPSRYDKCYYPMGDLRNERDGWLNNNNGIADECVQQPGSGISDCPVQVECEAGDENCTEVPYKRLADWTTCGDWKSGGKNIMLSWLECNYDSLHFRDAKEKLSIQDVYGLTGITSVTKEAQRMYDAAVEYKKAVKHGNEDVIPLFAIRHFNYWPHKSFIDNKSISNNINTLRSQINMTTLEQQSFTLELMGIELSTIMEDVIYSEKKNIINH